MGRLDDYRAKRDFEATPEPAPRRRGRRRGAPRFVVQEHSARYALFRAGKDEKDWMIHRMDPPAEARDPFPEAVAPMLARPARLPRQEKGWAAEVRWEGVRAIAFARPGRLRLADSEGEDITAEHKEIRRLARQIGARDVVLDGVVRTQSDPPTYAIFDLLHCDGENLMAEPYAARRRTLQELDLDGDHWQTPKHSTGHARELLEASREQGLGGLILKRLDSRYEPGRRADSWRSVS